MGDTFRYTVIQLVRMPGVMVWALLFPLILMTVFSLMFSPLDEQSEFSTMSIAVVEPGDAPEDEAFRAFINAVSEGDERLFNVHWSATADDARQYVLDSADSEHDALGYVELADGVPQVHVMKTSSMSDMTDIYASILTMAMDEFVARTDLIKTLASHDPAALARSGVLDSLYGHIDATMQVDVTHNQPKETVRYYFALLGMAALFGGSVSLVAFQRMKPNTSALGARRSVGAVSHGRAVMATLLACWVVNFVCLCVAYAYMRLVVGIDFAGRDVACLTALAASSLVAMALGCAISAIPKVTEAGKSGILTALVCFSALFAGLYGQPTMALADSIATNAPIVEWVNPASQIAQSFYSVMYYDTWEPFAAHVGVLVLMSAVLLALSVGSLRRQRYASL